MSPVAVASRIAGHNPQAERDGAAAAPAAAAEDVSPFMTMQHDGRDPPALHLGSKDGCSCGPGVVQGMLQERSQPLQPLDSPLQFAATAHRPPVPRRSSADGALQRRISAGGDQQYGGPAVVPFMPLSSGWASSSSYNSVDGELERELTKELDRQKPQQAQQRDQGLPQQRLVPWQAQQQLWKQDSFGMFTGLMQHPQQQQLQQQQQQKPSTGGTQRHGRLHKLLSSLHLPHSSRCRLAGNKAAGPAAPHQQLQQQHAVSPAAVSPHSQLSGATPSPAGSATGSCSSASRQSSPFAWCNMRLSDDGTTAAAPSAAAAATAGAAGESTHGAALSPVVIRPCPSSTVSSMPAAAAGAAAESCSNPQRQGTSAGCIVSDPGGPPLVCMLSVSPEAEAQLLEQLSAPPPLPPQEQRLLHHVPAAPVPVPQLDSRGGSSINRHIGTSGRHSHRLNSSRLSNGRRSSLDVRCSLRAGVSLCPLGSSPKEVSSSLRSALVQLEHTASMHANRLKERVHCGLARLTSLSGQAEGVLPLPVGREVLRDWEFGPELGCGASCVTRLVQSRTTGQTAACKTITKAGIFRSAALKAAMLGVQRELAIMQHTNGHPHVVQLRGVYEDARALHLVMDWCAGGCLEALVANGCGGLGEAAAAAVTKAVLEVLAHVHERGVVHRDIKPGNVLLCRIVDEPSQLTEDAVRVTDFGISVPYTPGRPLTELAGTLEYMAPEVLQRCYGTAADVWSTGVMLHELLSGQLPFSGDSMEQMLQCIQKTQVDLSGPAWESISNEAKQLVALCLQKDPRDRPTARQLLDTFAGWLELGCSA